MRSLTTVLIVLLTVSVAWAAERAPMPSLESYIAHPIGTGECGAVTVERVGYDTPETADLPVYDAMAWYVLPDEEHPLLIMFVDTETNTLLHFFLSFHHDGYVDKDGGAAELAKLAPNGTICEMLH